MKKIVAFCTLSLSLFADIDGTYEVSGNDPYDKNTYTGMVVITKDENSVYQAVWDLTENGKKYQDQGTGFKSGSDLNFAFQSSPGETESYAGLQSYKISDDTLEGPFVLLGKNLVGIEKLKRKK